MYFTWNEKITPFTISAVRSHVFSAAWVSTGPVEVSWPRQHHSSPKRTLFVFCTAGVIHATIGDERAEVPSGGAIVVVPGVTELLLGANASRNEFLLFSVDSGALGDADYPKGPSIHPLIEPALVAFAYGAVRGSTNAPLPTTPQAAAVASASAEAIGRVLVSQWLRPLERGDDNFSRARHFIRVHANEPHVNPESIAESLGISLRSLQAQFSQNGLTVQRELRRQRYVNANVLIANEPALTLTAVAARAGFGSIKQFRAARTEFAEEANQQN